MHDALRLNINGIVIEIDKIILVLRTDIRYTDAIKSIKTKCVVKIVTWLFENCKNKNLFPSILEN